MKTQVQYGYSIPEDMDDSGDLTDISLREAVRLGILTCAKDEDGRPVFALAPKN